MDNEKMVVEKIRFVKKYNEYDDVYSFYFDKGNVNYKSGQYTHLLLVGETREVREFSFASIPSEENLMFTMHVDTDSEFKKMINNLDEGEEVTLFKINGKLEFPVEGENKYVFLSGGVGIAPYRSLIKEHSKSNSDLDIKILQVQRKNHLFKHELKPLVNDYIEVHPDNFKNDILRMVQENRNALFYICGSKRFIEGVSEILNQENISEERIQIENFTKDKKHKKNNVSHPINSIN